MTARGDRTKAALIEATTALVAEVGYRQTTTKAIAKLAGISEGTIYRHFPDKRALLFAAVLAGHQPVLDWMAALPGRAGTAPLPDILTECLLQLAQLRAAVIPLEVALANDPEMAGEQPSGGDTLTLASQGGPPALLGQYLSAEQRLGRVRPEVDTQQAALVLLAALFGLASSPLNPPGPIPEDVVAGAVTMLIHGIAA